MADRRWGDDERAALRRVASLAGEGATSDELFPAVVDAVAGVLDVAASRDRGPAAAVSVAGVGRLPTYLVGTHVASRDVMRRSRTWSTDRQPSRVPARHF